MQSQYSQCSVWSVELAESAVTKVVLNIQPNKMRALFCFFRLARRPIIIYFIAFYLQSDKRKIIIIHYTIYNSRITLIDT